MEILSKFYHNGEMCFTTEDNGLRMPYTLRGLYTDAAMSKLCEAGYKYYDYHGRIKTPDGVFIKDLVEMESDASNNELASMMEASQMALTEAEAARRFTRDVDVEGIELAKSSNEIKTRGELIEYLKRCDAISRFGLESMDVRPLNSFVATEALFSVEELIANHDVRMYLEIIQRRRLLTSYNAYQKLISFLQESKQLGSSYSVEDVRRAYMAWGICGIKTKIIDLKVVSGVLPNIHDITQMSEGKKVPEWCLVDKDGEVYSRTQSVNLMDYDDENYSKSPITPVRTGSYDDLMRNAYGWSREYEMLECLVSKESIRTNYTLMGENGSTYRGRFEHDRFVLFDVREVILMGDFLNIRGCDGRRYPISKAVSQEQFKLECLAMAKARDLIRERTIKPPVDNSFELYLREGVSPNNALNYCAVVDKRTNNTSEDFLEADKVYQRGAPAALISKFNPDGIEYENIDELIDIMSATRDKMIEDKEYKEDDDSFNLIRDGEDLFVNPLGKLEFARDIMNGQSSVGELVGGMLLDSTDNTAVFASFIMLLVDCINGNDASYESKVATIKDIEFNELVDLSPLLKEKRWAYRGFLTDRARLNADRARQCAAAAYITAVFREISNEPVEQQRHYLFACMYLDLFNKRSNKAVQAQNSIATSIVDAIKKEGNIDHDIRKSIEIEAPSIALGVMFRLAARNVEAKATIDGYYEVPVVHPIEDVGVFRFNITISKEAYSIAINPDYYETAKICTLHDWCCEEMTGSAWNLYCLNADINPWYVKPKVGVVIPTYNFEVNFMHDKALESLSEGYQSRVKESQARITCLSRIAATHYMLGDIDNDFDNFGKEYNINNINMMLHKNITETVVDYSKRFKLQNKEASSAGKYLKSMRLKSDVTFYNFADKIGVDALDSDVYAEIPSDNSHKQWLTLINVTKLSGRNGASALPLNENRVEVFKDDEQTYNDLLSREELMLGVPDVRVICNVVGTKLLIVDKEKKDCIDLATITKSEAAALAAGGLLYQIGAREYLIFAGARKYKLSII